MPGLSHIYKIFLSSTRLRNLALLQQFLSGQGLELAICRFHPHLLRLVQPALQAIPLRHQLRPLGAELLQSSIPAAVGGVEAGLVLQLRARFTTSSSLGTKMSTWAASFSAAFAGKHSATL
jgi:hypothetical protein